jgi:outer membrane protein OmpA-like peptidoglycan-associated protein
MSLGLEHKPDLEEEALELKPLFRQKAVAAPSTPGRDGQQAVSCPSLVQRTVSGFPRHGSTISSLPKAEQEKLRASAEQILRSFQPGCQPILTVGLVGHADRDPQSGPGFEKRISDQRALAVQRALQAFIRDRSIVSRIIWQPIGTGAASLAVPNPRSEPERARNRRVEVFLGPIPLEGLINGVIVDGRGASISLTVQALTGPGEFNFDLYRDQPVYPAPLLPRVEWMRRGALLGLAQRAFTNRHRVRVMAANDLVQSIQIFKP